MFVAWNSGVMRATVHKVAEGRTRPNMAQPLHSLVAYRVQLPPPKTIRCTITGNFCLQTTESFSLWPTNTQACIANDVTHISAGVSGQCYHTDVPRTQFSVNMN